MNKSMTTWNLQRNSKGKINESISVDPFLATTQKPHKLANTDLSFIDSTQESIMQGGRKNRPEALGLFTSRNIGSPFNSSGDLLNNTKEYKEYSKAGPRATKLSNLLKASPVADRSKLIHFHGGESIIKSIECSPKCPHMKNSAIPIKVRTS